MLPKSRRLSPVHFPLVLEEGRLVKGSLVSLKVFNLQDGLSSRFGTIVSKRISPLAVKRNQLKRRLIMGFEAMEADLAEGWLVVALPSWLSLKSSPDQLKAAIKEGLTKAGLAKNNG